MTIPMSSKEAIEQVMELFPMTKSSLAHALKIQPIQIDLYLKGKGMSFYTAAIMFILFDIIVYDINPNSLKYEPTRRPTF